MRFYLLGVEGEGSGGVSLWHFLDQGGLKPPSLVMLGLVGGVVLGGYWYSIKREWDQWRTATLVVCLFFLVYPKIHSGYYMLPLALLLPYMVDDRRLYALTILMFGTVLVTFKFADGTLSPEGGFIVVPIVTALLTDIILVYILYVKIISPERVTGSLRSWIHRLGTAT